jgi:hypothetical protein
MPSKPRRTYGDAAATLADGPCCSLSHFRVQLWAQQLALARHILQKQLYSAFLGSGGD